MDSRKKPDYVDIDGMTYSACFLQDIVSSGLNYKPQPSDVFVVTYPKCGTTWMIQIVLAILRRGDIPDETVEYFACCPFLEMLGAEGIEGMSKPGCIKAHLPFNLIPYSPDAKYIYVARNPRDCCISFYHHTKFFPGYRFGNGTFDDFFHLFVKGETDHNDYFDNLLSWYEHRNDPNIFFTTFENMKKDPKDTIIKLSQFLGEEYFSAISSQDLLDKIIHVSSFDYMKDHTNNAWRNLIIESKMIMNNPAVCPGIRCWAKTNADALDDGEISHGNFMRKGVVKEEKPEFREEHEKMLKKRIEEKTKGSDVMELWKDVKLFNFI